MIFSFIFQHKDAWPVTLLCNTLGVSPAGFYAWLQRPRSAQQQRRDALLVEIAAIHAEVKERYCIRACTRNWPTAACRAASTRSPS